MAPDTSRTLQVPPGPGPHLSPARTQAGTLVLLFQEFYSEINAATLTGAIDVIVVEQEDGTFRSSPFHVRFGKLGVLKAREKIVSI